MWFYRVNKLLYYYNHSHWILNKEIEVNGSYLLSSVISGLIDDDLGDFTISREKLMFTKDFDVSKSIRNSHNENQILLYDATRGRGGGGGLRGALIHRSSMPYQHAYRTFARCFLFSEAFCFLCISFMRRSLLILCSLRGGNIARVIVMAMIAAAQQ